MFYFFQKANDYLRCELRPTQDGWFELIVHEPGCPERIERFGTSRQAEERWDTLRVQYNVDGWAGPFGRE